MIRFGSEERTVQLLVWVGPGIGMGSNLEVGLGLTNFFSLGLSQTLAPFLYLILFFPLAHLQSSSSFDNNRTKTNPSLPSGGAAVTSQGQQRDMNLTATATAVMHMRTKK